MNVTFVIVNKGTSIRNSYLYSSIRRTDRILSEIHSVYKTALKG